MIETSDGNVKWTVNMQGLAKSVRKEHNCEISRWRGEHGLYPGRAFVLFAEYSSWIHLNTNTIPFYKFFPKLEGKFPSNHLNILQGEEGKDGCRLNRPLADGGEECGHT